MSKPKNALAAFFSHIAENLPQLDCAIAHVAKDALLSASTQHPHTSKPKGVLTPSELEQLLHQHASPELSALEKIAHTLPWTPTKTIAKDTLKSAPLKAIELIGPKGLLHNDALRVGLLIQPAHVHYPRHRHAAEELYLVLSGTALWGQNNQVLCAKAPGSFRHHKSWEWHEIVTEEQPLLTLWCWTGDLRYEQYEIAQDE